MTAISEQNNRILIIDDNRAIHDDFRKILCPKQFAPPDMADAEAALFGEEPLELLPGFQVDSAFQGQEGLNLIEQSLREGRPYAMAFVDVRMPPGWDGVETTAQIWQKHPDLQVVICTAYSDYTWQDMLKKLGHSDRLIVLKKPFDCIEVVQLAVSMTEKWRLYQQAKWRLQDLEKMVTERTAELEKANKNLLAANDLLVMAKEKTQKMADAALVACRAKGDFLANMSHEIRTPMNGVIGLIELLLETQLSPEQRKFAADIKTSADALLCIINDILDFSKIEAGKMTFEKISFDLKETVESAMALLRPRAEAKGILLDLSFDPGSLPRLIGDPMRLRQILLNLVGNAIKFTDKGGVLLEVSLHRAQENELELHFSVCDTGIGISEAHQKYLFQSFTQADVSTSRRFGGSGLGLAICQKLTKLLGGTIGVESYLGQGSVFSFILPFGLDKAKRDENPEPVSPVAPAASDSPTQAPAAQKISVLLAEDNPIGQTVALLQLKKLGYLDVGIAINGVEAVKHWRQKQHGIILMDCQMPEMDGCSAARKIRELEIEQGLARTWIIAMTASAMPDDRENCLAAGMNDYISKPVNKETLKSAMDRAMIALKDRRLDPLSVLSPELS